MLEQLDLCMLTCGRHLYHFCSIGFEGELSLFLAQYSCGQVVSFWGGFPGEQSSIDGHRQSLD